MRHHDELVKACIDLFNSEDDCTEFMDKFYQVYAESINSKIITSSFYGAIKWSGYRMLFSDGELFEACAKLHDSKGNPESTNFGLEVSQEWNGEFLVFLGACAFWHAVKWADEQAIKQLS